jgi:hypothetical protein
MKRQFFGLFVTVFSCLGLVDVAIADTLTTKGFKIDIQVNCEEGNVTCVRKASPLENRVSYRGQDLKTGKSLRLSGKTIHSLCGDGVTPCRFLGYEFRNRNYRYIVTEGGLLEVYKGEKLLVSQQGTWDR